MKKFYILFTVLLSGLVVSAQNPIKNFSFENWVTNANNKLVPADWETYDEDLNANAVRKHSTGSHGSSAIYLGCYNDGTDNVGSNIFIEGTLTSIPASLTFDYIIQNNNSSFFNGLVIDVYFYDGSGDYLDDFTWDSELQKNNASFENGVLNFTKSTIATAKSYEIDIYYFNLGGATNEYTVVDNIKFSNTSNNVSVSEVSTTTVSLYPNPTTGIFNYSLEGNEKPSSIVVTSVDGKQTVFEPNFTNSINISTLVSGIYTVSFLDEKNTVIGRNKILLTK